MAQELDNDLRLQRELPSRIERKILQEAPMEEPQRYRPNPAVAMFIIGIAIMLDLISFIPGANDVTTILADIIFIPWFMILGIKFTGKRALSFGAMTIVEIIPGLSIIPMITISSIYSLYFSD